MDHPEVPATHRADRMAAADLTRVLEIERACFGDPWTRRAFLYELTRSPVSVNLVLRDLEAGGQPDAYLCAHCTDEEAEINNIAVHPARRRLGLGRALMLVFLDEARGRGCTATLLQVRRSNAAARALYRGLGFAEAGVRPGYYSAGREDAIVMALRLRVVGESGRGLSS